MSGRRVKRTTAIAVVLLCFAVGVLLGLLAPPETFLPAERVPMKVLLAASPPVEMVAQETAARHAQSSETEPAGNHEIQNAPAAEEKTNGQATVTSEPETPQARIRTTVQPDTVKSTKQANGVKHRKARRKHVVRAKRERYAAPQRPQRSIVSQVPIVGPVFGLLGP
jgi:hypothetical protein